MRLIAVLWVIVLSGCVNDELQRATLFTDITEESGVTFRNDLTFTEEFNPYTYRNFYNGAGVAIGDINNDGLHDIYFAGNQVDNKLYLNKGNLRFEDITEKAGVACQGVWATGVTFVDINADGLLDIYVCKSGPPDTPNRNNELFINNGNLTFTERAGDYGLDITGLSVQASFFDYDKDGDLDCYLLTNSFKSIGNYDIVKDQRTIPDPLGAGNKFFRNDNGRFRDYSAEAGIYRSNIGFGLGITLGDFNDDAWVDIFVSNDFFERDYLYLNDQKGGFRESLTDYFESISMGSMGADLADLDNDGHPELFVTEMLPDSLHRKKTKTVYESWNKYVLNLQNGYHHQFSRNVLQKRTSAHNYVELGRMAGLAASEWSWGALLFDMNNDGNKDVFIANGIYKDLLDRDFLTYTGAEENVRKLIREEEHAIVKLIDQMPSSLFPNYAFRNEGELAFSNATTEWGLDQPMFSSGSAYADLDNDGDLELIVSNINAPAVIYRNNTDTARFKSIRIALSMPGTANTFAVGSMVTAFVGGKQFCADNFVTRGFQSSVQPDITIGIGEEVTRVDSLIVAWPNGGYSVVREPALSRKLDIRKDTVVQHPAPGRTSKGKGLSITLVSGNPFRHLGSGLTDFNRDRLLPMMYSNETPSMAKGDVNGDGIEEIYVGGGKGQPGAFIAGRAGKIRTDISSATKESSLAEETRSCFLDADNDGDLDLYVASGGRFFPRSSTVLNDKLMLNDGNGTFTESAGAMPADFASTSGAQPIDFDNDGDQDLVVGERFDPFVYGIGGRGFLLENDGTGKFRDVTKQQGRALEDAGMITDIAVQDINADGWHDIVLIGDWMPITLLVNEQGRFTKRSELPGLANTEGWWRDIEAADFNQDGKIDFVVGNHGLNTFFKEGDRMYVNDFDGNGSVEQVFCTMVGGKYYPIVDKDELLSQLPSLKKQLLYYQDYGKRSIDELFPPEVLSKARVFQVNLLSSIILLSDRDGYRKVPLPLEAQYSPIFSLLAGDFDNDGTEDLIAGGNQYLVKPQFGRYDASYGWFFKGVRENGSFTFLEGKDLDVKGQIRDIEYVEWNSKKYILFARYDDDLAIYEIQP